MKIAPSVLLAVFSFLILVALPSAVSGDEGSTGSVPNQLQTASEWAKIGQSIIVSICAVLTVFLGFRGFRRWRDEHRGKAEIEISKAVIRSVYKIRRGITSYRSPHYSPEEEEIRRDLNRAVGAKPYTMIYNERWKKIEEPFVELESLILEAEVEFGTDYSEVVAPIRSCISRISEATKNVLGDRGESGILNRERLPEFEAIVYSRPCDPESKHFSRDVEDAVNLIDSTFGKRFRA